MKKILALLFTLLLLVGCQSEGYSQISNGTDVIFKGPNATYTKNDLYKSLKVASFDSIEKDILKKIAEKIELNLTDVETEADEVIEMYKSMGYEQTITSYYGSVEAFKETYLYSGLLTKLSEKYIEDKYDEFVLEDKPVKMQIVSFYEEEIANKFIEDFNSGKTFETAAVDNGYAYDCPVQVYLDSDELLPLNVKSYLNETVSTGLSQIIVVTDTNTDADGNINSTDTYYVLNIISRDPAEFKDEYITKRIDSTGIDVVKEYYFNNHDIAFYDQDIYEIMKEQYEVIK